MKKRIVIITLLIFTALISCNRGKQMTDEEMQEFADKCYQEMKAKQEKLRAEFKMGSYDGFSFDQRNKTLQFIKNEKIELEFSVILIGTWARNKNTWLWAWANSSMIESIKDDSTKLQGLADETGFEIFSQRGFDADENFAWELAAISAHYLDAIGVYRAPGDKSDLFIAIMGKKQV